MWYSPVRCRRVLQVVARCVPGHTQHAPSPIVVFGCGGIRHIPYAAAYVGCICGSTIGIVQPVNLSDSTCYVWHGIRDARHCPPNDYHPQPTCTFRMRQYARDDKPAVLHDRASRHPSTHVCNDIRGLQVCNLTRLDIMTSRNVRMPRHTQRATSYPNGYYPPPTRTFRMQQHTRNNYPPPSTPQHHNIRQRTYATTYTRWQSAVLHARASRHPSTYACRDIRGLSVR